MENDIEKLRRETKAAYDSLADESSTDNIILKMGALLDAIEAWKPKGVHFLAIRTELIKNIGKIKEELSNLTKLQNLID